MINDLKILDESPEYTLGCRDEEIILVNKGEKIAICIGEMYGNPDCGLIVNKVCIIGGEHLLIWDNHQITKLDMVGHIVQMRIMNDDMIEFLIDPWSNQASVWQLNLKNKIHYKISDFENLKNMPYTEEYTW
ncbi:MULTISPECIES: hypothetical protein [unclassified Sphingobacterium]|uniref:hypothetical protein n=1 Tax=unclassified Sphingobacterium TaxID=2609468 RepID=UPI00104618BA|nr:MULTISPECIES: hypothetical protein [unclassified Sphingobacterium]MCS3556887.1 hypothetical protein [Sphingobacterium sp. JUb21]TCQ98892.1 hypothetical protein EDF66_1162 [Sphingobacterium sp. JUb20]